MITFWIAAIILFGVVEAATAGLVSIWFVAGSAAALLVTWLGAGLGVQIALFIAVSFFTLLSTRPLVRRVQTIVPTNADRVLGRRAKVVETVDNENSTGAVYIEGKTWTARSEDGLVIPKGKLVTVIKMEGVKLFVREEKEN